MKPPSAISWQGGPVYTWFRRLDDKAVHLYIRTRCTPDDRVVGDIWEVYEIDLAKGVITPPPYWYDPQLNVPEGL